MKPKTKLFVLIPSFCIVLATCLLSVFAVKNFNLNMAGEIEFVAPGIEATISQATLLGLSKKEGSGQMQQFTITHDMTSSQIASLSGVQSWSGIKLGFDEVAEGKARLSFTITNNSTKTNENIMVNMSTNTSATSPIQTTPSADFCLAPNSSHTFSIDISVANLNSSASLTGFKLTVELSLIKPSQVTSISDYETQGFSFETNKDEKTASLQSYTGTQTEVEIPAIIKDASDNLYNVTGISDASRAASSAFYSARTTLTEITLPTTLTKIGRYAFNVCTSLTNLIIPNGVTLISASAFSGCTMLKGDLIIPNNVTTIESSAFSGCGFDGQLIIGSSLTIPQACFSTQFSSINVIKSNKELYANNSCLISKQDKILLLGSKNSSIPQDDEIKSIGTGAFKNSGISGSIVIPNTVTQIDSEAFSGCTGLTGSVVIPDSVIEIGTNAFLGCTGLNGTLTFGKNLTTIGLSAFSGCTNLTGGVVIPDSVTSLGASAFDGCMKLNGELVISKNITEINNRTFYNCRLSGQLLIPNKVTRIGTRAFVNCEFSGQLIIPNCVQKIEEYAFDGCQMFTGKLEIPNSVTTIGANSFRWLNNITEIVVPSSVTSLGAAAFYYCNKLTSITFYAETPAKINGNSCFDNTNNCPIYVPSTSIDEYKVASYWKNYESRIQAIAEGEQIDENGVLTTQTDSKYTGVVYQIDASTGKASIKANSSVLSAEIVILDKVIYNGTEYTVDTISASAFANNTTLTKITIPSGVTTIETKAFAGCTSLANISFENTANWHASITKDSAYGTAVSTTNISHFTTDYCDLYIKSGGFTSVLTKGITATLAEFEEQFSFYIQYTNGMTWADLINHDTFKHVLSSKDDIVGTLKNDYQGVKIDILPERIGDGTVIPMYKNAVETDIIDPAVEYIISTNLEGEMLFIKKPR